MIPRVELLFEVKSSKQMPKVKQSSSSVKENCGFTPETSLTCFFHLQIGDGDRGISKELEGLKSEFTQCNDANEQAVSKLNFFFFICLMFYLTLTKIC